MLKKILIVSLLVSSYNFVSASSANERQALQDELTSNSSLIKYQKMCLNFSTRTLPTQSSTQALSLKKKQ